MHILYCTLHTLSSKLYMAHWKQQTINGTLPGKIYTTYSIYFTFYNANYSLHTLQDTLYDAHFTLHTILLTLNCTLYLEKCI